MENKLRQTFFRLLQLPLDIINFILSINIMALLLSLMVLTSLTYLVFSMIFQFIKDPIIKLNKYLKNRRLRLKTRWNFYIAYGIITFFVMVIISIYGKYLPNWTGFPTTDVPIIILEESKRETEQIIIRLPEKFLWDWIELLSTLAIPILVAYLANSFQKAENERERIRSEKKEQQEKDHLNESRLQKYLDDMSNLLLENNIHQSNFNDLIQNIAEVKTRTIVRQLDDDSKRQEIIFLFLLDANLLPWIYRTESEILKLKIGRLKIDSWNLEKIVLKLFQNLQGIYLAKANLQDADLSGANFQNAELVEANLQGANLFGANFQNAELVEANLQGADLSGANLQGANLYEANLQGADLSRANLQGANLYKANLQNAQLVKANLQNAQLVKANLQNAQLVKANLIKARGLTDEQIESADFGDQAIYVEEQNNQ